jgi:hypothetical protein
MSGGTCAPNRATRGRYSHEKTHDAAGRRIAWSRRGGAIGVRIDIQLGTLDPGTTSAIVVNLGVPAPVSFSDTINFSLASVRTSLVGSLTDLSTFLGVIPVNSLNFNLDLFSTTDPLTSLGNFTDGTGTALAFSYLNLAAGDYFFRISGDIGGAGVFGNAYSYRFEVSEVPLPPALLLFATALGGMAVAVIAGARTGPPRPKKTIQRAAARDVVTNRQEPLGQRPGFLSLGMQA